MSLRNSRDSVKEMLQNATGMVMSRTLRILTIFMVGFPILHPLLSALVFQLPIRGVVSIALSPLFYLASLFWVMSGIGLRSFHHWAWYTFGIAQVLAAYFNALILVNHSNSDFKGFAFVLVMTLQYLLLRIVSREIRVPYLFPKINWWESGIAGIHHLAVDLTPTQSGVPASKGQLLDLNPRGCFIKTPLDFRLHDPIQVRINAYGQELVLSGKVVWNAKSTVTHPKGIGIQFGEFDRALRRKVRVLIKYFNQQKESSGGNTALPS
ncbi:MAG: PilZ domain-containing protein [Bdellovibrionales bacterium]|nr:PilZ domain-containing protein [Bdellovibrionales bacterium]